MANLFTRDDTFFGVCQALGDDFGFNPVYLRIALGVSLLLSPTLVLGGYAIAGIAVAASRLLVPEPGAAIAAAAMPAAAPAPAGGNDNAELLAAA